MRPSHPHSPARPGRAPALAVAAFVALLLAACGASRPAAPAPGTPAGVAALTASDRARLEYFYLEATQQKLAGRHSAAIDLLQHCLDICPDAPEALFDMALYRLLLHQDSMAGPMLLRASQLDPRNAFYLETLAGYYLDRHQPEQALPHLETLATLQPRRSDVLSQLASLYSAADRPADAIRSLDRIEVLEGKLAAVSYRKFALYMSMDQEQKAFGELEALCREYPHEMTYRLAIGNQLLKAGRTGEAKAVFDEVGAAEPANDALKLSRLELYRATGQDDLLAATRDSLMYAPATAQDLRAALLRDYIAEVMDDDSTGRRLAEQAFDSLGRRFPRELSLLNLKAAYLATYEKQNDSAFVAVMDNIHELEPSNTQALLYLIRYYGEHRQFARLEDICRRGVLTHPEELLCHFYLGLALYQQERKGEALRAFQNGIVQKTADSPAAVVAEMYSIMGEVLHEMGRETEAFAAYDSCLVYQSDNASCLNNYAYFLSLRQENLDRAEEMSFRSLRLEPANKTYLDTYAWILFMKQRYTEARMFMDRVCPPEASDSALLADPDVTGVVLEHAGDIAANNGDAELALRFWTLAREAGGSGLSALLPKKIKLRKYIKE